MLGASLTLGSQWNLIYNGSSGLLSDPGRPAHGALVQLVDTSVAYSSFRLLIVSKRGYGTSTSFSEWWLLIH